eukprot:UN04018
MDHCDTSPLLGYDDALRQLTENVRSTAAVVEMSLQQTLGEVLARDITSAINVPGCAMSSMDGYAIHCSDLAATGKTRLPLSLRIAAGDATGRLKPGSAARIFTGAPVPDGADADR